MHDVFRALSALLALVPLTGCCAISQSMTALFCGPRKEPWLEKSYETPRQALNTFLGAVARDDRPTIYRTLSFALKDRMNVGEPEFEVFWQRQMADTPGLNIADQAEVTGPFAAGRQRVRFRLTLDTLPRAEMDIFVRRQDFWSVRYQVSGPAPGAPGTPGAPQVQEEIRIQESSQVVSGLTGTFLRTLPDPAEERTPVQANAPGPEIPGLGVDEIVSVQVGREWKIDGFGAVPEGTP